MYSRARKKCHLALALAFASLVAPSAYADGYQDYPLQLSAGWNLIGNDILDRSIDVRSTFGVSNLRSHVAKSFILQARP